MTSHERSEREALNMQLGREELAERIARAVPEDGRTTPLEGLTLNRCSSPAGPLHAVAHPCLVVNGQRHRIARAVRRLRDDFDQSIRVENLAEELGMSASSFYAHFKAVTDMTPLQFQKQLQLQEARRLMLSANLDAATAGYRVGYNDASHFSREYKRLFGRPPMRDVERLREAAGTSGAQIA